MTPFDLHEGKQGPDLHFSRWVNQLDCMHSSVWACIPSLLP